MARLVNNVLVAEGVLTARTAIHVGGADASLVDDMPFARNGAGELYIPGTSLAGPMRAWWTSRFGDSSRNGFFGSIPERNASRDEGEASFLTVDDAQANPAIAETRDGVRIDRTTGTAEEGFKYDREVVPAGATFDLKLRLELDRSDARRDGKKNLATLLATLQAGNISFGAAKSRGLGAFDFRLDCVHSESRSTRTGMIDLLKSVGKTPMTPIPLDEFLKEAEAGLSGSMSVSVTWKSDLPVLNLGSERGIVIDSAPLLSGVPKALRQTITGASIKGLLRTHAARICGTLFGVTAGDTHPLVVALFGSPGANRTENKQGKSALGLAAVSVEDCTPNGPDIDQTTWQQVLRAGGLSEKVDKVKAAQDAIDASKLKEAGVRIEEHVAIDRWTGGAAENHLFNIAAPARGQVGIFRLGLDWHRLAFDYDNQEKRKKLESRDKKAALALFLFVLRDMARGLVPAGYGSTRGFGSFAVSSICFEHVGEKLKQLGFADENSDRKELASPDFSGFAELNEAWSEYLRENRENVEREA